MIAAQRQDAILRALELRGAIRIAQMAAKLEVTKMTIRRDLLELEERELIVRVHGGAISRAVAAQQATAKEDLGQTRPRPVATIGLIAPSANYYYPPVIQGASAAARELNCRLVLGTTNYSEREELRQAQRLIAGGVDALMITPRAELVEGTPLHDLLAEATIPVVVVERAIDERSGGRLESVRSDHPYGATLAVRHLAELGHQRIVLAMRDSPTGAGLADGYDRAMARLGLDEGRLEWILPSPGIGEDGVLESLEALLDACAAGGFTAAVVLGDSNALALVDLALERGLRIPEDLAIISYDDEVAAFASVPLTAVAPPKHDLGDAAMRLCVDRLREGSEGGRAVNRLSLLPQLVERESTRPAN